MLLAALGYITPIQGALLQEAVDVAVILKSGFFKAGWLHAKLALVIAMSAIHGFYVRWVRAFVRSGPLRVELVGSAQSLRTCVAPRLTAASRESAPKSGAAEAAVSLCLLWYQSRARRVVLHVAMIEVTLQQLANVPALRAR
jgi:hypothetical protein